MLNYRRETALQGALVLAKSGRMGLGYDILRKLLFNHCDIIGLQSYRLRNKTQNKGYYAVQGHSRSPRSVQSKARMRLPISD